jgi:hypothetical protein
MSEDLSAEITRTPILSDLRRYARDNPVAAVAGATMLGILLARFAFLRKPRN